MTPLRFKAYISSELVDNLLWNVQAEPNSLSIQLFRRFQEPEELEQFVFILVVNPNTRIWNSNLNESIRGLFEVLQVLNVFQIILLSD